MLHEISRAIGCSTPNRIITPSESIETFQFGLSQIPALVSSPLDLKRQNRQFSQHLLFLRGKFIVSVLKRAAPTFDHSPVNNTHEK